MTPQQGIQQIVALLAEQTDLARQLVQALQDDKPRIIQHDTEALEKSNLQKEELMVRLHATERRRQDACIRLAQQLGLNAEDAVVSKLCHHLGSDGAPLAEAADRLRAVVASLRDLVAISHGFLEQSILGIRGLISLIASFRAQETGTYDASGRIAADATSEAVALRQEA